MGNDDYNSAGFLAIIMVGIMLIVAGLFLMGDASRVDQSTQLAKQQRPAAAMSGADEPRSARF